MGIDSHGVHRYLEACKFDQKLLWCILQAEIAPTMRKALPRPTRLHCRCLLIYFLSFLAFQDASAFLAVLPMSQDLSIPNATHNLVLLVLCSLLPVET